MYLSCLIQRNTEMFVCVSACDCERSGTVSGGCDKRTGVCLCKPGITGARCDACARSHCASFPECPACPSCYFSMNTRLQELTLGLERLSNTLLSSSGRPTSSDASRRIRALQDSLILIQESVSVPPQSSRALTEALQRLDALRYTQFFKLKLHQSSFKHEVILKSRRSFQVSDERLE